MDENEKQNQSGSEITGEEKNEIVVYPVNRTLSIQKIVTASLLLVVGFLIGIKSTKNGYTFEPKSFKIVNREDVPKEVNYNLLWHAIDTVNEKYIEKKPTAQEYLYGAVKGAVSSTGDPYTAFFPPQELDNFKTELKGEFFGIGAEIGKKGQNIMVVAPIDDTPAKKAGILARDIILKVNGVEVLDWTVEEAVSKIRGPKGTAVTLTLFREGRSQPFDVKIIRDKIEIKSVKWEIKNLERNGNKNNIAVITISRFGDDTENLFNQAVNDVLKNSVSGVILDLRNNPGGYLETAVRLVSSWVEGGKIAVTEEKSGNSPIVHHTSGVPRLSSVKTVVLVNGGSASAAEILAGALRDHNIAKLVGEKTFGKGSVQELVDLPEGGAVKVTVARWITPSGKNLNKDGLNPDFEVKLSEDDIKNGKDPQTDKAIEELLK